MVKNHWVYFKSKANFNGIRENVELMRKNWVCFFCCWFFSCKFLRNSRGEAKNRKCKLNWLIHVFVAITVFGLNVDHLKWKRIIINCIIIIMIIIRTNILSGLMLRIVAIVAGWKAREKEMNKTESWFFCCRIVNFDCFVNWREQQKQMYFYWWKCEMHFFLKKSVNKHDEIVCIHHE